MAEFQEVINQYKRMCGTIECDGEKCKISQMAFEFKTCEQWVCRFPNLAEEIVMEWAANHPKPMYPTWQQWHEQTFPNRGAFANILPCLFIPKTMGVCGGEFIGASAVTACSECRKQRIPADVAEKLGIKPDDCQ